MMTNWGGLSLDIKAAHKRVVIRESERGLLGFSHAGRLYFYKVAPFGAIFSAHWWGRLGAFLVRLWHLLIYIKHSLWLYVDDFLFSQNWKVLPLSSTFICIFFQLMKLPISWKKSVIPKELQWIGWRFNFSAGLVSLDPTKRKKLINLIEAISGKTYIHKRDIERFLGLGNVGNSINFRACDLYFNTFMQIYFHLRPPYIALTRACGQTFGNTWMTAFNSFRYPQALGFLKEVF